ncbi:MAG TPA: hypothetical protein VK809_10335 [Bacteroidia bacterium]|nr:hypothetical protein [Bacteroidia bacterium]
MDGKFYYFKQSFKSEGRDYFFEFWSEIIATEIGQLLGFNILRYDIAIDGEVMGCISESMISADETLTEGGQYLRAYDIKFDPQVKDGRRLYSFQLIEDALDEFELSDYVNNIIEVIVFDSIIGNGDRHQENWAFINNQTLFNKGFGEIERIVKTGEHKNMPKLFQKLIEIVFDIKKKQVKPEAQSAVLRLQKPKSFAPIFDNGSSLGRELVDEKVSRMLKNEEELDAYINRGVAEIYWRLSIRELLEGINADIETNKNKLTHFELIKRLLGSSYAEITEKIIRRVVEKYDSLKIEEIVMNIDLLVPQGKYERYKLPENRKFLIVKLVTLRIERLKALLNG